MKKKIQAQKNPSEKEFLHGKVLVVEDDVLLSKVLKEGLQAEKFEVCVVANGSSVFRETLQFCPDIMLLDLILPGIDGFAVLKRLKAETRTKKVPIAVITNLSQPSDVKTVKELGADQYFLKANTEMNAIVRYVKKTIKK